MDYLDTLEQVGDLHVDFAEVQQGVVTPPCA